MDEKNREKITLIVGGSIAFLIIYLSFFALPVFNSIKRQENQIQANEKKIAELKKLLKEYKRLDLKNTKKFTGSLSSFVEQKAKEVGITIAYIKPFGEKGEGVEVKIDEIDGRSLLRFINEMESNEIRINSFNLRDYKGTGIWILKINMES